MSSVASLVTLEPSGVEKDITDEDPGGLAGVIGERESLELPDAA